MQQGDQQNERQDHERSGYSLEGFVQRLQELRRSDGHGAEPSRELEIQIQAQHALALAREDGILVDAGISTEELLREEQFFIGSEHWVDIDTQTASVAKITIPPAFGLIPGIVKNAGVSDSCTIEPVGATPIEYLLRWIASNEVFGDDVRLQSVIRWPDQSVSFAISQPQYHGRPAEMREIIKHFENASWSRLKQTSGRLLYFNYAYNVLAMDMESRNCYMTKDGLQPFDVLLMHPDTDMEDALKIY